MPQSHKVESESQECTGDKLVISTQFCALMFDIFLQRLGIVKARFTLNSASNLAPRKSLGNSPTPFTNRLSVSPPRSAVV
jgi:hypothetical protein